MAERPNILVIMSDQHNPHILGCEGDKVVKTPSMDRLAQNGILFENCYCPAPLCVPSRMSFMSSRYPYQNEVWTNICHLSSDIPTFAHSLSAAGYETVLCGRMHFCGPDQRHGFMKRLIGDVTGEYIGSPLPALTNYLLQGAGASRKAAEIAGPGRTGYQLYDETVADTASGYIRDYAKNHKPDSDPFCMVAGFVLPHCPFVCPDDDFYMYYDQIDLPQFPDGYFENLHPAVKEWRRHFGIDNLTEDEIRRARSGYYGLVAHFDRQLGKVINAVEESGLSENTVIVYTSDHGEMAGEHGMWWKMNHYEGSASVPLMISWPGHYKAGIRKDQIVNLIDIGPTLIDIAGADPLPDVSGRSMLPIINGTDDKWSNESFTEYCPNLGFPPSRMIRKGPWKLVHYDGYRPQLFNLHDDPMEYNDLGDNPDYANICKELTDRILDGWSASHMQEIVDRRFRYVDMHVKWFNEVKPSCPDLWSPPPGTNVFKGDPDSAR
ncbi:MAG: sulfatase-like hydrolase/transferase [Armatimonadota bacterium]